MLKNRKAALSFIFITVLIDVIGIGIIIPIMPQLISQLINGSLSEAAIYGGWLMFAYAGMQFLFAPVLGGLSDQYGRRSVLLISLFGFGLNYFLLAWAPTIHWLFIGRVISGIMGASMTTASAYIADISTKDNRAQNFGLIGAAFGMGFIIGPPLGGVIGEYGARMPFIASGCLALVNWLYGYFVLPESLDADKRRAFKWSRANPFGSLYQLKKHPVIIWLILSLFVIHLAAHSTQSIWTYYTMLKFGWSVKMVGLSLAAIGFMVAVVQGGLIRIIIPKIGAKKGVYYGIILYMIGFILFAFASESWMLFLFMIPYALSGIAGPSIQGILTGQVPENEQGELQGSITSMLSLSAVISPPIMTAIFYKFTSEDSSIYFPGMPFLFAAFLVAISFGLAVKSLKNHPSS